MHKHAKIIMEWAQMMQMPKSEWRAMQYRGPLASEKWLDLEIDDVPAFSDRNEYRWAPRTIHIGDIDVPEPMRTAPDYEFYYPVLSNVSLFNNEIWLGSAQDIAKLERGLIHLDKESAITHAKALLSLTQKKE